MRSLSISILLLALFPVAGLAGDGVAALQTAAPSCPAKGSSEIYTPCDNGTVTDNRTGLVWLADATCLSTTDWQESIDFVAGLAHGECGLTDGSSPGEWRLPSILEWEAMVADAVDLGCIAGDQGGPAITNDLGTGCWSPGCPVSLCSFSGVSSSMLYWSSTWSLSDVGSVLTMDMTSGLVEIAQRHWGEPLWPVRGGQ